MVNLPRKLNIGCGRDVRDGWCNLNDREMDAMVSGRDLIGDVSKTPWDWYTPGSHLPESIFGKTDWFYEMEASHVIEHVPDDLAMMQTLWHVAKAGAKLLVRCPYGSSDDADDDPTHVRRMFMGRWGYYSQPYYHLADYGYRGDWQPDAVDLLIYPEYWGYDDEWLADEIKRSRNIVAEMVAHLHAVKPRRAPERELQVPPVVTIVRAYARS